MTLRGPIVVINTNLGWLRYPVRKKPVRIGDRLVPPIIEIEFPGADGIPRLDMRIEILKGVPRCTELTIRRSENGRELRQMDLRAIELDAWVEEFVALCSAQIVDEYAGQVRARIGFGEASHVRGMNTIRDVRKGSRRAMTDDRRGQVAEVYNAHDRGGIEAVQAAFGVSRSTATRYIKAAREAGLIGDPR